MNLLQSFPNPVYSAGDRAELRPSDCGLYSRSNPYSSVEQEIVLCG
jgi:hypothetical protein